MLRTGQLKLGELLITLIPNLGVALGGDEEFFGLGGEGLHQGVVADLVHNEVAELAPVGLLRVEMEDILAGLFLGGVIVPEVKKSQWLFDSEAENKE